MPTAVELDDDDPDEAPFHLPMLGLYADLEAGSGSVQLPDEFFRLSPALRQRILDDWLRGLQALRDRL